MSTTIGMEIVQLAVMRQIRERLDAETARQMSAWESIDRSTAALTATVYRKTTIQRVDPGSYVPGDRPSVIKMPWDFFPAISVVADRATLSAEGARDDYSSVYAVPFYVEAIVSCDPFPSQDVEERLYQQGLVDRRCKRTADAIVQCLVADRTLGGIAPESNVARDVRQTPPFEIQGAQTNEFGESCIFCLARVEAQTDIYAALPGVETVSSLLPMGVGLT